MSDTVTWEGHIVVAVNKRRSPGYPQNWTTSARLTSKKPAVSGDEVAVKISVKLPVSLFQKPQLEARISVPAHAVQPLEIGLDVIDNIEETILRNTGFSVKLVPVDDK